jgi:translation initiation factor IF-2
LEVLMANQPNNQQKNSGDVMKILMENVIEPAKKMQGDLHRLRQQFEQLNRELAEKDRQFRLVEEQEAEAEAQIAPAEPVLSPKAEQAEVNKTVEAAEIPKKVEAKSEAAAPAEVAAPTPPTPPVAEKKKPAIPPVQPPKPAAEAPKQMTKVVSTVDEMGREVKTYTDDKGNVRVRKFLDLSQANKKPAPSQNPRGASDRQPYQRTGAQQGTRPGGAGVQNRTPGSRPATSTGAKRPAGAGFTAPIQIPRPQDQKSFGNKNKTHERTDDKQQTKKNLITRSYAGGADYDDDRVVRRAKHKKEARRDAVDAIKITHAVVSTPDVPIKVLSEKIGVTASEIIKQLFKESIFKTINDFVDFDFAAYIASMYGVTLELKVDQTAEDIIMENMEEASTVGNVKRPPIVTVMGHVDHGKTSLLDVIRQTNVATGEAGGITQHIGAYTVTLNGEKITFIDTPGHAAFTAMRARGAKITDVAIIVVAADDGVMPQTIEAINHAKAAGVSIIVAINKIDKPDINVDRIKQQLSEMELVPEEWGGDTVMIPVSAKAKLNLDKLLEAILTVTELKELVANPERKAQGTVIEAKLDKGRGAVATILVSNGTLNVGDNVIAGLATGKIRAMFDDKGKAVKSAGPSMPVEVLGFSEVPQAGDFMYVADEKLVRKAAEERKNKIKVENAKAAPQLNLDGLFGKISEGNLKTLNLIIKTDVQGSLEALKSSLEKISNDEVKVRPIHGGVGAINETDIMLARASDAIVIGFNVRADSNSKAIAEKEGVDVRLYNIIYDAVDDVTSAMKGMLTPKFREVALGTVEVRDVFRITGVGTVAGAYVTSGKVQRGGKVRVYRNDVCVYDGNILALKRFKDDVKEVASGYECGISVENYNDIKTGDIFEVYINEEIKQ